jgi:hypothetical protein
VCTWTRQGLWGYEEVRTYECPRHGPIFIGPQTSIEKMSEALPPNAPDDGDRDSLVSAPRKPSPTLDVNSIAVPEPDQD